MSIIRLDRNAKNKILRMVDLKKKHPYHKVNVCRGFFPPFEIYNIIKYDDEIQGYVSFKSLDGGDILDGIALYKKTTDAFVIERICARHNKVGLGSKLLEAVEKQALKEKKLFLRIHSVNDSWWKSKGFNITENLSRSWNPGEKQIRKKTFIEFIKRK